MLVIRLLAVPSSPVTAMFSSMLATVGWLHSMFSSYIASINLLEVEDSPWYNRSGLLGVKKQAATEVEAETKGERGQWSVLGLRCYN